MRPSNGRGGGAGGGEYIQKPGSMTHCPSRSSSRGCLPYVQTGNGIGSYGAVHAPATGAASSTAMTTAAKVVRDTRPSLAAISRADYAASARR